MLNLPKFRPQNSRFSSEQSLKLFYPLTAVHVMIGNSKGIRSKSDNSKTFSAKVPAGQV